MEHFSGVFPPEFRCIAPFPISLPRSVYFDIFTSQLQIPCIDIGSIYASTVRVIIHILDGEFPSKGDEMEGSVARAIIMSGGLGASSHVKKKVSEWCELDEVALSFPMPPQYLMKMPNQHMNIGK